MVTIKFTYFEIMSTDFTGIIIKIIDKDGTIVTSYRNFDPADYEKAENTEPAKWRNIWKNQSESFDVKSIELAKHFITSNNNYLEVSKY